MKKETCECPEKNCFLLRDYLKTCPKGSEVLQAYFRSDLSVSETARKLYVHRNTVLYWLDKIARDTGFDARKFSDAMVLWMEFAESGISFHQFLRALPYDFGIEVRMDGLRVDMGGRNRFLHEPKYGDCMVMGSALCGAFPDGRVCLSVTVEPFAE